MSVTEAPLIPLNVLRPGATARIDQVVGDREVVRRLGELGLRDGTAVEMVQPGTPCIIRLAGKRLCFRGDDATRVLVRVEA